MDKKNEEIPIKMHLPRPPQVPSVLLLFFLSVWIQVKHINQVGWKKLKFMGEGRTGSMIEFHIQIFYVHTRVCDQIKHLLRQPIFQALGANTRQVFMFLHQRFHHDLIQNLCSSNTILWLQRVTSNFNFDLNRASVLDLNKKNSSVTYAKVGDTEEDEQPVSEYTIELSC